MSSSDGLKVVVVVFVVVAVVFVVGLKVVGISGMVASDIDDLVVATVIPGLGKDMADVQVRISAHLILLILSFCHLGSHDL